MNRLITATLTLLAFAFFCFYCIYRHAPMIQRDIVTRTAQALSAQKIPVAGLSVSGRDVLLSGVTGSPIVSGQARQIASTVTGVRIVNVNVTDTGSGASLTNDTSPDAKTLTVRTEPQRQLDTLLNSHLIEFSTASDRLTSTGRATLNQIVPILAASPTLLCSISGYTDSTGDRQENMDLSQRRATAIKDYLVNKGIAADRLAAEGYGDANPIASNDTSKGRRKNRRIEFLLKERK